MDAFDLSRAPWDAGYGITVQIPTFPLVVTAWFAAGLLWIAALWLTLDARRRARGGEAPPLAPIVALGLLPTVVGVWRWKAILVGGFDAAAGRPPGEHNAAVLLAADTAGHHLATFAWSSSLTIVVLAIGALALLVRAHRRNGAAGRFRRRRAHAAPVDPDLRDRAGRGGDPVPGRAPDARREPAAVAAQP